MDFKRFWKIHCFTFSPYKCIRDQIWSCHKIGQGQHSVIIWTNLVVLEHPMMQIKFQCYRPFGAREEDFFKIFTIYGHIGHLGHKTWTSWTNVLSLSHPIDASYEIWLWLAQWFLRRRCWKCWQHTYIHTYIQRTEAYLSYKLTTEPSAQVSEFMSLPFCWNKRLLYIKSFYNKIIANKVRSIYTVFD